MRKNRKPLAALISLLLLCALCLPALAEKVTVKYIEYKWDGKKLTSEEKTCTATKLTGDETGISTGWYVASDTLTYDSRLSVSGDARLILADNSSLTAKEGIMVNERDSLSIFAQSEGDDMGALTVPEHSSAAAGIGGKEGNSSGLITIHGGKIDVTKKKAAGIGGGALGNGNVTIYGGEIMATAIDNIGAGIGGGDGGDGNVTIYGGTVTATTSHAGAGIGGGYGGTGTVTIHGGTVTANSGGSIAIGNGEGGSGGSVTIKGGNVSAVHKYGTTSIGGSGCTVSLGWKDADDYITATGYAGNVELAKSFLIEGTAVTLPAGPVDISKINRKRLLPNCVRDVKYVEYTWDGEKLTRRVKTCAAAKINGDEATLSEGWYVAMENVTFSGRPVVSGNVGLILADGIELKANAGITVEGDNTLSIFAQREGEGMGALTVPEQGNNAGIGGTNGNSSGLITIHGGTVTATAYNGAGIGGGGSYDGQGGSGNVTIYGGTVTATANHTGAAIGGGCGVLTGGSGTVEIYGGTVTAEAYYGAGIGGGYDGEGTVEIHGGTVLAHAYYYGAGIGGGAYRSGEVTIEGGTVTVTASGNGAAIGNGVYGSSGKVTVTGGCVSAVHTNSDKPSIGGDGCAVSLGLTNKNDSVYAAGYTAKDNTVTLTAALQDAGTGEEFPAGGVDISRLARKLLVPKGAAGQYAWSGADFSLPGSLTGIGSGAFQNIRAATVLVPQTVKKIGPEAFRGSGVKRIKFENGDPEEFNASAFTDCPFVIVYTPAQGKVYETLKDLPNIYIISK